MGWKKWAEDKGIRKWFRRDNFIVLALTGVLLVIIALPTKETASEEKTESGEEKNSLLTLSELDRRDTGEETVTGTDTDESYAVYLEERLTEMLSQMADVGKVKVMITLKSSRELVVEKEQPVSRSSTNESDSQGGTRVISQVDSEENTVYRTEGSSSVPFVIKTLTPQIEGVVVVAEGAGTGAVNKTIVEIARALFGVEAHKVMVVKMERETEAQSE